MFDSSLMRKFKKLYKKTKDFGISWTESRNINYQLWKLFNRHLLQTLFSLYLYNQWTNFHKLSCTIKLQMRAICTYVVCTKVTTNNWDIRSLVTVKSLFANISWMTRQIHMIKLTLESAYQTIFNNMSIYKNTSISI